MTNRRKKRPVLLRIFLAIALGLLVSIVAWHLFTGYYGEEEKTLRRQVRETVIATFPDRSSAFLETFGLYTVATGRPVSPESVTHAAGVVLIHGLDDPGKVWQNLAPELLAAGHPVWLMNYPNDQPVAESADLLFDELATLRSFGVRRIAIVAHSMGGLVTREMLTRPALAYPRAISDGRVPRVDMLIMVGTPNHGSQMARFRVFSEVRDYVARLTRGEADWLAMILDGAGEAKIDLLPGSRFLDELNARPHPRGVQQLIIAGIISPWRAEDIRQWREEIEEVLPPDHHAQVDALSQHLIAMTHGLGDGLVTVESTRLDGVPHRTVAGTHLTMIRNLSSDSARVPPAVPIIVGQLKQLGKDTP